MKYRYNTCIPVYPCSNENGFYNPLPYSHRSAVYPMLDHSHQRYINYRFTIEDYIRRYGIPPVRDGVLDLSNLKLTSLQGLNLLPNKYQIIVFYLSGNKFTTLSKNQISVVLQPGVFAGLVNLQILHLNNSEITNLDINIFAGLNNLRELHLANNQLENLPHGIFSVLPNLQILDVRHNRLQGTREEFINNYLAGRPNVEVLFYPQNV